MKRTHSLKRYIFILMAVLVALQSLALVASLALSEVFNLLDAESYRLFSSTTESRATSFNRTVGDLIAHTATEAEELGRAIEAIAEEKGVGATDIFRNDSLYLSAADAAVEKVMNLLQSNSITGAFVIFNGSNNKMDNPSSHSAVYIRNSSPDLSLNSHNFQIEVGPANLSKQHQIAMSNNWTLDMDFLEKPEGYSDFYDMPVWASKEFPHSEIERYGYWSAPISILENQQQVICYTMPLLDSWGEAFGVIGFELSLSHLSRNYLPNTELPYENSFYIISHVENDEIDLSWYIPSGPIAQTYLRDLDSLALDRAKDDFRLTMVRDLGQSYCSIHTLRMYSGNSPFFDNSWSLVSFVNAGTLHETSQSVRRVLIGSILLTTLISFGAVILMSSFATHSIANLPKLIRSFNPMQEVRFQKTGMLEIDELTAAIESLNSSVVNATKTTSKIMELAAIPMGGFEILQDQNYVVLTGFLYDLLDLSPNQKISIAQWDEIYRQLIKEPAPDYEDVYAFQDDKKQQRWLRIGRAETGTGYVGTVLDVTEDVERSRRLAHELDYDALTHLYNRNAFKREVFQCISLKPEKVGVLIFADLDNLKLVNDTYGHDAGDRFIVQAAEMFSRFAQYGGVISRISGDEFAIYLHNYDTKKQAMELIHSIFDGLRNVHMKAPNGAVQPVRWSAGAAFYPDDADNVVDLLKLADYAMYEAKRNQKGTLVPFSRQSYQEHAYLLNNRENINRLIDEKLIRFALQPIVDLKTGEVFGYEALMRPLLNTFSSPLEILSVAADQSKLSQIERLVILQAFRLIDENQDKLNGRRVFINSLPSQRLAKEDAQFLSRRYPHVMQQVVIEITEGQHITAEDLLDKVSCIKEMGISLALDDFCARYSNELRILSLSPDLIKIDMSIIQGIHENTDQQRLLESILEFCTPRKIQVVAEGIEDPADLCFVHRLGVDYVQGYYTGRPSFEIKDTSSEAKTLILQLNKEATA